MGVSQIIIQAFRVDAGHSVSLNQCSKYAQLYSFKRYRMFMYFIEAFNWHGTTHNNL